MYIYIMNGGIDIPNLKKALDKNSKSLLFAQLADAFRQAAAGNEERLDEALAMVNKGLETNSDFLPGKLVRGRILLEKGDLTGAKIDFEAVAERDPFCLSAQKLLLETLTKLGQQPKTEIYAKILNILEPEMEIKADVQAAQDVKVQEVQNTVAQTAQSVTAGETNSLSDALDSILEDEDDKETEILNLLLQKVENILAKRPAQPVAPNLNDIIKEQLADKGGVDIPDVTKDIDSLLATALDSDTATDTKPAPVQAAPPAPAAPNIDELVKEQLADKGGTDIPDVTGDIDSLLATAKATASDTDTATDTKPAPVQAAPPAPAAPNIDELVKEQLADKGGTDIPDVTGDIDSLLATAKATASDTDTVSDTKPAPVQAAPPAVPAPAAPNIDELVKEQLADKGGIDIPDVTGDIDSLLATTKDTDTATDTKPAPVQAAPPAPAAPNIDELVKEQLADKGGTDIPDVTGDINSLLATAKATASDTDTVSDTKPAPVQAAPPAPAAPNIDELVKEQLADKGGIDIPDVTGDINSLLKDNEILAQNPTPTLAELYISQGLPQKAAAVYKELLTRDPGNVELRLKLAMAEAQM